MLKKKKRSLALERMESKLEELLQAYFPGHKLTVDLYPATGFWRQTKADVMQFTGGVIVDGNRSHLCTIGCWESITDCLRYGFEIHDERGKYRAEADFVIVANDRSWDRSKP